MWLCIGWQAHIWMKYQEETFIQQVFYGVSNTCLAEFWMWEYNCDPKWQSSSSHGAYILVEEEKKNEELD